MKTFVYLIQHGYGGIKIGVSKDPKKRCKQLQTGNQKKLRVIATFSFKSKSEALIVEELLHRKFAQYRMNGEWFRKSILRKFKDRKSLFPKIFNSGMINDYDEAR